MSRCWRLMTWSLIGLGTCLASVSLAQNSLSSKDLTADGASQPFDAATVVAQIGDRSLTLGELMFRFATLPPEVRHRYGSRLDAFLDDVVSNLLVAAEAERLGVDDDPRFELLMQIQREDVLRDLYARRTVLSQVDDPTVTERYESQREARFDRAARVRIRHILVTPVADGQRFSAAEDAVGEETARRKIEELRQRLVDGDEAFDAVARQASEDASAPDGGDLGWLDPSQLDPVLAKTAQTLTPGAISEVLRSELGFHLVRVEDRRPAGQIPLSVVHELLYQELVGEQLPFLAPVAGKDRQRLRQEADIQIFPERLPW